MKIKMLVSIAGHADPENGLDEEYSFQPGDLLDVDDKLAEAWIAAGHAEVAAEPKHRKTKAEAKQRPSAIPTREEWTEAGYAPEAYDTRFQVRDGKLVDMSLTLEQQS